MERTAVTILAPRGSSVVRDETTLCKAVGLFFVEVAQALRKVGVFKALPRAPKCYIGVSTVDGEFGWPAYEDRGPDNMV